MEKEEEISSEDVKKQFDEIQTQQAEAEKESSTDKTKVAEKTAEVVKTETAEETEQTAQTEEETKAIPYSRFKEVNDRLKELEELEKEAGQLVERGPDGKIRVKVQPEKKDLDKDLELTEDEKLLVEAGQTPLSVVKKEIQKLHREEQRETENNRVYREQSKSWWDKAQEEFKDQGIADKNSVFYKRANKIFMEQYFQDLGNGKWTAPPNSHYLSCLQAEKELQREKVKTSQVKIEEKKNQKQQVFVEKKSNQQQSKKKVDEKDFENASPSEQDALLKEQWDEAHPDGAI